MAVEHFLSNWNLLNPKERSEVFAAIYRTLPQKHPWLAVAKEVALNLTANEADQFNGWWRHYRKTGEISE